MRTLTIACMGVALAAATLAVAAPATASTSPFCSERPPGDLEACVAALSRDGAAILTGDPSWVPSVASVGATGDVLWGVGAVAPPYSLSAGEEAHTWSVTINTRAEIPRLSQVAGEDVSIARAISSGEFLTTITGRPTLRTQGCDQTSWPWLCPTTATSQAVDFSGRVTDYRTWMNAKQRAAFYGSDLVSNIDATAFPPQVLGTMLIIDLANSHYLTDGTTLAAGFVRLRLPYALLAKVFGIKDPSSLASGGVAVVLTGSGGGTITSAPSGDGALLVEVSGLTFSTRKITLKRNLSFVGRPHHLKARRIRTNRTRLSFDPGPTRGLHIVRYEVRCASRRGDLVSAFVRRSPTKIGGLIPGVAYTCRVRALAKNRFGRFQSNWSAPA